jgi:hypothetical protein
MRGQRHSFDDFFAEVEAEAHAEGPDAVAELEAFRRRFAQDRLHARSDPRIDRGFETLAKTQRRNALSDEEATALAIRALREIRTERR